MLFISILQHRWGRRHRSGRTGHTNSPEHPLWSMLLNLDAKRSMSGVLYLWQKTGSTISGWIHSPYQYTDGWGSLPTMFPCLGLWTAYNLPNKILFLWLEINFIIGHTFSYTSTLFWYNVCVYSDANKLRGTVLWFERNFKLYIQGKVTGYNAIPICFVEFGRMTPCNMRLR